MEEEYYYLLLIEEEQELEANLAEMRECQVYDEYDQEDDLPF